MPSEQSNQSVIKEMRDYDDKLVEIGDKVKFTTFGKSHLVTGFEKVKCGTYFDMCELVTIFGNPCGDCKRCQRTERRGS